MKTLSASLLALALATGAGYAQLSSVTDATARTTQDSRLDTVRPGELQSRTDVSGHARQRLDAGRPMSRIEQMRLERAERQARQAERAAARSRADAGIAGSAAARSGQAATRSSVRGAAEITAPDTRPARREAQRQANHARAEVRRARNASPSVEADANASASNSVRADGNGNTSTRTRVDGRAEARVEGPDRH